MTSPAPDGLAPHAAARARRRVRRLAVGAGAVTVTAVLVAAVTVRRSASGVRRPTSSVAVATGAAGTLERPAAADTARVAAGPVFAAPTAPTAAALRSLRDPRAVREAALADTALRVLVALDRRRLYVLHGADTLRVARVGVGMDSTLEYEGRVWRFRTPRGVRQVRAKDADPVWVPPEWHYVEVAQRRGLHLAHLPDTGAVVVDDTTRVAVRDGSVGLVRVDSAGMEASFTPFAADEEVIWAGTLYVPPVGAPQRRVAGQLGPFRLDLGDGYLLHGTPHAESVGQASSHGCMRLADADIGWLYRRLPVGTRVYTY